MAKGFKSGGRNFKTGESGNLKGRPKISDDVRLAINLNTEEFVRICNHFFNMPAYELDLVLENDNETTLKKIIAKILREAIDSGDQRRLEFFLDRTIGKPIVKGSVEVAPKSYHAEIMELIRDAEEKAKLS